MKYFTKADTPYYGKPKVYFCCHPDDYELCFGDIAKDIFSTQNCSIWFCEDVNLRSSEEHLLELKQMQLFVLPVTAKLLNTSNPALDVEFPFALENKIPVLPVMQEVGLEDLFNCRCGELQFLDKHAIDPTAISFHEKLAKFLTAVLISDEQAKKIRVAFDAYVFLSYRKKDRKEAQELMRLIHKNEFARDIAIWYDEFLVPGENFNQYIEQKLRESDLFVLAVTPSVLEKRIDESGNLHDNYIVENEYRIAKECDKIILPAELAPTDRDNLRKTYEGIPDCVDPWNDEAFSKILLNAIHTLSIRRNNSLPEHNFLIGLAYLGGVDVEVNYERAVELITSSAEAGLIEAMDQLIIMYSFGIAVQQDNAHIVHWLKRKISVLEKRLLGKHELTDEAALANAYQDLGEYRSTSLEKEHIAQAGQLYSKAFSLWEKIETDDQKLLEEKNDAIHSLYRLQAIWYESNNELDTALEMYQVLLEQRRSTAAKTPDDLDAKKDLALILCDIGILHQKLGDHNLAANCLHEAIEICESYVESFDSFAIIYGHASNRLATVLETNGDPQYAMIYNTNACEVYRHLCTQNRAVYELRLAEALLNKGILLTALGKVNDLEAKKQFLKAIDIYENNPNHDVQHLFCEMVAYYKLANIYCREGDSLSTINAYEDSIAIAKQLENAPPTEETMAQLAIIYLDYGTLCYALKAYAGDINKVVNLFEKAIGLYELLCKMDPKYSQLLNEAKEKLITVQDTVAGSVNVCRESIPTEALELLQLIEKGSQFEDAEKYGQALALYFTALQKLDELIELNEDNKDYLFSHIDLCEQVGDILRKCGDQQEAVEFYELGYIEALVQLRNNRSERAVHAVAGICEKLGSVSISVADAKKYYTTAYNANKVLAAWTQTEETYHHLASTAKKLATVDGEHIDVELLSEARDIWKNLFKETLDERYFLLYLSANRIKPE